MPDGTPTGPVPPQLLAMLAQRPGGVPMPGASPAALPGTPAANPAAALAQRPGGGGMDQRMMMLVFLAGMGFPVFADKQSKMQPKAPKEGMQADAARAPGMAVPPQLAAMLAARQAGLPPNVNPLQAGANPGVPAGVPLGRMG